VSSGCKAAASLRGLVIKQSAGLICIALQGHANKNKGLMTASGAITLKGPEIYDELQADIDAVSRAASPKTVKTRTHPVRAL
jgi:hypothetical protein